MNHITLKINAKETDLYRMGSANGEAKGKARGKAPERAQIIKTLYLKKKLEIRKIAELLDLPETDVQKVINLGSN